MRGKCRFIIELLVGQTRALHAVSACRQKTHLHRTGASVVDVNITGNSLGADWDGSAGAANSSALAKGVWSVGRVVWEVLWSCQVAISIMQAAESSLPPGHT